MERGRLKTDEQAEKLRKQINQLKKRVSVLKGCNSNIKATNRNLNMQLRAEKRINESLKGILYTVSPQIGYYELSMLMKWVEEVVTQNEELQNDNNSLKHKQFFEECETIGLNAINYEFFKPDGEVAKTVAWTYSHN
ncbi:hypothetical protein [Gaoshiqia sp. Z1-71]|uniref:hypothetical protein n=1 Tax=Gaoshiqia hydrogeniformans TaxID=3290090 RepID=UPI003BF7E260